jgi:hypothetical protein
MALLTDRDPKMKPRSSKKNRIARRDRLRMAGSREGALTDSTRRHDPADGWFPIWLAAAAFGITRQTFHDIVRPLIQAADVRGAGQRGTKIRCKAAIDAWTAHKVAMHLATAGGADAYLFGQTDSPWLEKLREYKAGQEKIKLEDLRATLIPRDQLMPALGQLASAVRKSAEMLSDKFGRDAGQILGEAIDEATRIWEKMLKEQPA